MISLTIHGNPVPAGRPRFTRNGHAYDPPKSRAYKQLVAIEAKKQYRGPLLKDKPIEVYIAAYRENQKQISKIERTRRERKQSLPLRKPDTDNYVKSVLDALTGVIWADDNIICHIDAYKFYSDTPRIEVIVREIEIDKN
ncbi:RusA family crossover junction endodeoxyribonuclease [Lentilactobacillus sp. SPB1-3]|uniref:RusA family crossover junction endodeoxyribonuclease n=1 Tax=Lentilactobacillus terminaliae TaxID=3003483 RepID=A0ACD5DDM2_9LACO|nr:RusA family crossover junction endodeoxyribonuclease [Lentilactobacillus sp. SPB1-3]MCZ0978011.1 RusA family crossover junction endodeoxyribonuclease [Lentilactobacillus sp. SPB1-3]